MKFRILSIKKSAFWNLFTCSDYIVEIETEDKKVIKFRCKGDNYNGEFDKKILIEHLKRQLRKKYKKYNGNIKSIINENVEI